MKKKTRNKMMLGLLTCCMLVMGMLPTTAFAETKKITELTLTGVKAPVPGEPLTTEGISLGDKVNVDADWCIMKQVSDGVDWILIKDTDDARFYNPDKYDYVLDILVSPKDGYEIAENVKATFNSKEIEDCDAFTDENGVRCADISIYPEDIPQAAHTHKATGAYQNDADNHWNVCECGEKMNVTAHSFKWVTDKEATAAEKGSKHEECTVCGYKKPAVEIPATGSIGNSQSKPGENKPNTATGTNKTNGSTSNTAAGTNKANNRTSGTSPKTGDNSMLEFYLVLLLVSGAGAAGTVAFKKKKMFR